jgi:hypothetical protein
MYVKTLGTIAILALGSLTTGCVLDGFDDAGSPAPPPGPSFAPPQQGNPATIRGYLVTPRVFTVSEGGSAHLTARRLLGPDLEESDTLPILDGKLTVHVRPDGRLVVDALSLSLGDIQLSEQSVPPHGITLRDVKVGLQNEAPPECLWASDESSAAARGSVRLLLDWSLVGADGEIIPLAQQRIDGVPMELEIVRDAQGKLVAVLSAAREGVFLRWTGYMELADLRLELEATQD